MSDLLSARYAIFSTKIKWHEVLETRDQKPETRDWRPDTGDQRLETRDQRLPAEALAKAEPEIYPPSVGRARDQKPETGDQRPEAGDRRLDDAAGQAPRRARVYPSPSLDGLPSGLRSPFGTRSRVANSEPRKTFGLLRGEAESLALQDF